MEEENTRVGEIIKTVFSALKPWLNYELWKAEERTKSDPPPSTTFIDELKRRGATDNELKGVIEGQEQESVVDEDLDPAPIIIG